MRSAATLTFAGLILLVIGQAALAGTLTETNAIFDDPPGTLISEDPKGPHPVSSFSEVEDSNGHEFTGFSGSATDDAHALGAMNIGGFGAARASGEWAGTGIQPRLEGFAKYTETVTNTSGAPETYEYDFSVFNIRLAISDFAGADPSNPLAPRSTVKFFIEVAGTTTYPTLTTVYSSSATLYGGLGGVVFTPGGSNPFTYAGSSTGNVWTYTSGGATDTLELGKVLDGDTLSLSYTVQAVASAAPYELGAYAQIGDPNNLLGTPGATGTLRTTGGPGPGTVIPLPASAWMGLSLLGLLGISRLKRRRN